MSTIRLAAVGFTSALALHALAVRGEDAAGPVVPELPVLAVPKVAEPPQIDGETSDEAWRSAAVLSSLQPAANAGPADRTVPSTVVRVLWDDTHLHIAFDCVDGEVYRTGTLRHDDDLYKEDVVEVFLDGVGDGRQFVEMQVAPDGTNLDLMYVMSADVELAADLRVKPDLLCRERWGFREWEMTGLRTAARQTPDGWSAELSIPAADVMRRRGSPVYVPGEVRAQFVRYDHVPKDNAEGRRILQQTWVPVLHGNPHNTPALMGSLMLSGGVSGSVAPSDG